MLASRMPDNPRAGNGGIARAGAAIGNGIARGYAWLLDLVLAAPLVVIGLCGIVIVGALITYQRLGEELVPEEDRGLITIVEGRTDKGYFRRLQEAFPPDTDVKIARREELLDLIAEVGIETKQRATVRSRDLEGRDAR